MGALATYEPITSIQIDAHLDWRDSVNGAKEGCSSGIRRASESPFIKDIFQIGLRGIRIGQEKEMNAALRYGANLIGANETHEIGIEAILNRILSGGRFYLMVDADGIDSIVTPSVNVPNPGGLTWLKVRKFIHGIVNKGRVLGVDLMELSHLSNEFLQS